MPNKEMTDQQCIAQARAMIGHGDYDYDLEQIVEQLADIAEKWQQIAAKELGLEAGQWRKIVPYQVAAIELAISIIDQSADSVEEDMAMKILSRLLPEEKA